MKKTSKNIPLLLLVLAIGIFCIVAGIFQGDFQDTFRKASLICYECIGIG